MSRAPRSKCRETASLRGFVSGRHALPPRCALDLNITRAAKVCLPALGSMAAEPRTGISLQLKEAAWCKDVELAAKPKKLRSHQAKPPRHHSSPAEVRQMGSDRHRTSPCSFCRLKPERKAIVPGFMLNVLSRPSFKAEVVHHDLELGSWLPAGINADRRSHRNSESYCRYFDHGDKEQASFDLW